MVLGLAISLYWWKSKTGRLDVCQISCCKVSEDRGYQWCQLKITHIFQKSHMHGINTDGISATALPLRYVCSRLMHLWWCCLVGCNFFGVFHLFAVLISVVVVVVLFGEGWEAVLRGSWWFFVRWSVIFLLLYNWWQGRFFFYSFSASHSLHLPNFFLMLICLFIHSFWILYECSSIFCMLYPSIFKSSCITTHQLYKQVSI